MWPFAARGARADTALPDIDDMPALEAFVENDTIIKVWLPTKLSERIDWLSVQLGASRPDVLRGLLFEHVYGRVALRQLEEFARRKSETPAIWFSKRVLDSPADEKPRQVNLAMLGKATDDFKLHLPARLKTDLADLSKFHGITVSHYIRKALVLVLMGERFHSEWQLALGKLEEVGSTIQNDKRD
jgi:predicted DNA-binding protein